jgi:hypothetical protein
MKVENKKYQNNDFMATTTEERIFLTNVELLNILEAIRYEIWKINENKQL